MKILTAGTFDLWHFGHVRFLKKCLNIGPTVIGLNTDDFIKRYKGKPPIMTYEERELSIKETFDDIQIYPNDQGSGSMLDLIDALDPTMIVVGSDWLRKDYLKQIGVTADDLDKRGISLCFVPYEWNISSTEIKKRCQ